MSSELINHGDAHASPVPSPHQVVVAAAKNVATSQYEQKPTKVEDVDWRKFEKSSEFEKATRLFRNPIRNSMTTKTFQDRVVRHLRRSGAGEDYIHQVQLHLKAYAMGLNRQKELATKAAQRLQKKAEIKINDEEADVVHNSISSDVHQGPSTKKRKRESGKEDEDEEMTKRPSRRKDRKGHKGKTRAQLKREKVESEMMESIMLKEHISPGKTARDFEINTRPLLSSDRKYVELARLFKSYLAVGRFDSEDILAAVAARDIYRQSLRSHRYEIGKRKETLKKRQQMLNRNTNELITVDSSQQVAATSTSTLNPHSGATNSSRPDLRLPRALLSNNVDKMQDNSGKQSDSIDESGSLTLHAKHPSTEGKAASSPVYELEQDNWWDKPGIWSDTLI